MASEKDILEYLHSLLYDWKLEQIEIEEEYDLRRIDKSARRRRLDEIEKRIEKINKHIHDIESQQHTSLPDLSLNTKFRNILILTVNDTETRAVREAFKHHEGTNQKPYLGIYHPLGTLHDYQIFLVQSEMGSGTLGGSQATVTRAISDLLPKKIIMCGIAFGLIPTTQTMGDVLVSKHIVSYELQKRLPGGRIILRGDRASASTELVKVFRAAYQYWDTANVAVHFGTILSGEKLINDPDFRDALLQLEPEAIGGEMEGAGVYSAAQEAKVDWILVKAINDWADGKKSDANMSLAASNAASYLAHALEFVTSGIEDVIEIPESDEYRTSVVFEETLNNIQNRMTTCFKDCEVGQILEVVNLLQWRESVLTHNFTREELLKFILASPLNEVLDAVHTLKLYKLHRCLIMLMEKR